MTANFQAAGPLGDMRCACERADRITLLRDLLRWAVRMEDLRRGATGGRLAVLGVGDVR
jgi:hypothetical protein